VPPANQVLDCVEIPQQAFMTTRPDRRVHLRTMFAGCKETVRKMAFYTAAGTARGIVVTVQNRLVDVKPMAGLEHLPFAEVWFHQIDDDSFATASAAARGLGKSGLEAWTTDATPEVVAFLAKHGYAEVRRYAISELDVAAAAAPDPPAFEIVSLAERPDLARALYAIACESYADQPGRGETRLSPFEEWRRWGLDPHPADAYLIALEGGEPLGYGYLELEGDRGTHGFTAVARASRGRGVAGSLRRAQIAWAKAHGVRALRTATETRLDRMRALNTLHGYRPLYEEIVLRGPVAPSIHRAR
jgi:GNAT superfamily N-acetyltransferase